MARTNTLTAEEAAWLQYVERELGDEALTQVLEDLSAGQFLHAIKHAWCPQMRGVSLGDRARLCQRLRDILRR